MNCRKVSEPLQNPTSELYKKRRITKKSIVLVINIQTWFFPYMQIKFYCSNTSSPKWHAIEKPFNIETNNFTVWYSRSLLITTDCVNDGCSFRVWKPKPTLTSRGRFLWFQKDSRLYRSLWKNVPLIPYSVKAIRGVFTAIKRLNKTLSSVPQTDAPLACHVRFQSAKTATAKTKSTRGFIRVPRFSSEQSCCGCAYVFIKKPTQKKSKKRTKKLESKFWYNYTPKPRGKDQLITRRLPSNELLGHVQETNTDFAAKFCFSACIVQVWSPHPRISFQKMGQT